MFNLNHVITMGFVMQMKKGGVQIVKMEEKNRLQRNRLLAMVFSLAPNQNGKGVKKDLSGGDLTGIQTLYGL